MNDKIDALITAMSNYTNVVTSWTSQTHKLWITNTPEDVTVKALNTAGVLVDRVIPNMAKITQGHLYMGPSTIVVGTAAELHAAVDSLDGRHITSSVTIELSALSYTLTKTLSFNASGCGRGRGIIFTHSQAVAPTITMPNGVVNAIVIDNSTVILDQSLDIDGVASDYGRAIYIGSGVFNTADGITLTINKFEQGIVNNNAIMSIQIINFTDTKYPVRLEYMGTGYIATITSTNTLTSGAGIRVHNGSYLYVGSVNISGGDIGVEIHRSHAVFKSIYSGTGKYGVALYNGSSVVIETTAGISVGTGTNTHGFVVQYGSSLSVLGLVDFGGETLLNASYGSTARFADVDASIATYGAYVFLSTVHIVSLKISITVDASRPVVSATMGNVYINELFVRTNKAIISASSGSIIIDALKSVPYLAPTIGRPSDNAYLFGLTTYTIQIANFSNIHIGLYRDNEPNSIVGSQAKNLITSRGVFTHPAGI